MRSLKFRQYYGTHFFIIKKSYLHSIYIVFIYFDYFNYLNKSKSLILFLPKLEIRSRALFQLLSNQYIESDKMDQNCLLYELIFIKIKLYQMGPIVS